MGVHLDDWVTSYCPRSLFEYLVDDHMSVDDDVWSAWVAWLEDWHGEHAVVGVFDPPEMTSAFRQAYHGTFGSGAQFAEEYADGVGWDEPKVGGATVCGAVDWEVVASWLEDGDFSFLELDSGMIAVVSDCFDL